MKPESPPLPPAPAAVAPSPAPPVPPPPPAFVLRAEDALWDVDGRAPSWQFRTTDHVKAAVFINGIAAGDTMFEWNPCTMAFDRAVRLSALPDRGIYRSSKRIHDGGATEVVIVGGLHHDEERREARKTVAYLADDEQLVCVRMHGVVNAFRLKVVGPDGVAYLATDFNPVFDSESDTYFSRSIFFSPARPE
jgi:hypothetical protein